MQQNDNMTMQLIADRINTMHADFKGVVESLALAVNKLVALEEKASYMNQNYERLERQLEKAESNFQKLEERMDNLEKDAPDTKRAVGWIYSAIVAVAGLALTAAGKFFGII